VRAALQQAYADGSWGRYHGPWLERLTHALEVMHGVSRAWCCCSGTIAVELALRGLKVAAGDEVILAGYDFPGNFRAIEAVGARPVLIDVDPRTWCADATQLDAAHRQQVRAIVVSHLHGGLAAMPQICGWAAERGIGVVEDACQVPGAVIAGKPAGAWGDVGVLSFGGSKLLTSGRGGAVLTDREDVFQRIKIHSERGNNACPLSELQAAVILPQLDKLAPCNRQRAENVRRLLDLCRPLDTFVPVRLDATSGAPCFYKLAWQYRPDHCGGCSRAHLLAALRAEGVAMDAGFRGFTRRSGRRCRPVGDLAGSREAAEATVLLHHPILLGTAEDMARVAQAMAKVTSYLADRA
jgi:dTDP-4-amino-4,6-dideoxygalactose transaminase